MYFEVSPYLQLDGLFVFMPALWLWCCSMIFTSVMMKPWNVGNRVGVFRSYSAVCMGSYCNSISMVDYCLQQDDDTKKYLDLTRLSIQCWELKNLSGYLFWHASLLNVSLFFIFFIYFYFFYFLFYLIFLFWLGITMCSLISQRLLM